ncbi:hypothetical protein [Edaphosphingomonas haloaromaticamans]|nr:hypothetical protein [Sphingomonas haloaromaticamans]
MRKVRAIRPSSLRAQFRLSDPKAFCFIIQMSNFNRMTIVAAAEVVAEFNSHSDMEVLEVQWDIVGRCNGSSKPARIASLARIAIDDGLEVLTEHGRLPLSRAMIDIAILAPPKTRDGASWKKLVAGLRFDGFELVAMQAENSSRFGWGNTRTATFELVRMLPEDVPELDFREAESEVVRLLDRHNFAVSKGHLQQAIAAFSRGDWSASNGELRKLYEGYLNEIAERLGCDRADSSKDKRAYLGQLDPPFLLSDYNEWDKNDSKPQYVQGLMNRFHPHGGHPGLSEEEDATFRLQISLITARLFLRRFDQRASI